MLRPILRLLLLTTMLALRVAGLAEAQSDLRLLLDPVLGRQTPRADYRITYFPQERVERQGTDYGFIQHRPSFSTPLWQDAVDEWTVSGAVRIQDFATDAVLPDTGQRFPGELYDAHLGVSYRHKFENGWMGAVSVSVGSSSDKPFHSEDELVVRGVGLLRVPQGERNAWLFSLIYANDERFLSGLSGIPIPGLAYQWVPSDRFRAVIGIPFSSIEYRPVERLTLEAQYFPVRRVRVRGTYVVFAPLRIWGGFDWDSEHYALADREDKDDRLFFYEKRLTAGIRFDLRHFGVEIAGGRIFDRFYFTGESYSNRDDNRIDIHDGWFGAAQLSVRF